MFNRGLYRKTLSTRWLGKSFLYLESTESTNTVLKRNPSEKLLHGTVLLADDQSNGRGQKHRTWISEPGKNLTFTIALFPGLPDPPARLTLLSMIAGWGVVRALREGFDDRFGIKWPNDIMAGDRKLGGILTENLFYGSRLDRVLIGIGLNVNQRVFPDGLEGASSIAVETGDEICREELLCGLLMHIEIVYGRWIQGDPSLVPEINRAIHRVGQWVHITVNGSRLQEPLKFLGVDNNGRLLFLSKDLDVITYRHEQIHILSNHPEGRESD